MLSSLFTLIHFTNNLIRFDGMSLPPQSVGTKYFEYLMREREYDEAGKLCQKILGKNKEQWENYIVVFTQANQIPVCSLCSCSCLCFCVCVCLGVFVCVCICLCRYIYKYACLLVYVCVCLLFIYLFECVYVCVCVCIYIYVCVCVYMCTIHYILLI